ncbi:MAG: hypothetical protein RI513_00340 [Balneolaceae bacterium]|nr:hypothetical protein [Balneolaceae bacterium]
MYILKWIFDHDLRLHDLSHPPLSQSGDDSSQSNMSERSLEDFLSPDPTYSRFYFSATNLEVEHFGLSIYPHVEGFFGGLEDHVHPKTFWTTRGVHRSIHQAIQSLYHGQCLIMTPTNVEVNADIMRSMSITSGEEPTKHRALLGEQLKKGHVVLFKEQSHHGYDVQMYTPQNIYGDLFAFMKTLAFQDPEQTPTRLFSINAKRMRSERQFYFEMWTLDQPPHGFEEVFPNTDAPY